MNERVLRILEYPKIIEKLTEYASSPMGKDKCRNLAPSADISEILRMQMETTDALTRVYKKGSLSFSGMYDIRGSLLRLKVGGALGMVELLNIAKALDVALRAKTYGRRETDDETKDSLDPMFNLIEPMSNLSREIRRCIIDEETVADDASPALKNIRRQVRLTNDRIHTQLNSMVASQSIGSKLQDNVVTMRGGRYCLPVKAEYRSQVPGMIHDQSSSGSTLFIEPMAIVKLNNDLSELAAKEKAEIERIMQDLSAQAAEGEPALEQNISILTELDFIFARASLSRSYRGSEPKFNERGFINLKKARHPLLDKNKVVPIDLKMGDDYRMLIITGPNTGGKTVSLKTVGLLTLMGQAGLHIPAFENSELSVFNEVYADIGDEQSIEQSLSTFSSHMTNIVKILNEADHHSLVLFDELCAGTDPTEGAALAMSILKNLLQRQVTTMATTHYSELKVFALGTDGVCNASCEFDVATLSPTYRLLIGIPGKSNAFAISGKLGLPEYIIDDARKNIDASQQDFESLLSDLEASRKTIEKEQAAVTAYRDEIETLKKKLEAKQSNLEQQKERILKEANEKAQNILQDAKDYADHTIRTINKLKQSGNIDMKAMEQARSGIRGKLDQRNTKKAAPVKKNKNYTAEDFKPGDSVKVVSMDIKGTVVSPPNSKGELQVQMGILKSRIHFTDLVPIDEEVISTPSVSKTGSGKIKMNKSAVTSGSINLIGETVDEAMIDLDKYLDDAYLAHIPSATIIHGRGTGALRKAVHEKLKRSKYVKSFRLGKYGEGETGVTIVEFKE